VDLSGWLEYFTGGKNAPFFAPAIEDAENLLVPVICIYEVFKKIYLEKGQGQQKFGLPIYIKARFLI